MNLDPMNSPSHPGTAKKAPGTPEVQGAAALVRLIYSVWIHYRIIISLICCWRVYGFCSQIRKDIEKLK